MLSRTCCGNSSSAIWTEKERFLTKSMPFMTTRDIAQRKHDCGGDTCSISFNRKYGKPHSSQLDVRTQAAATSQQPLKWWQKNGELWTEVNTEEEFDRALEESGKLVFVDFFATWCRGCMKAYPEICRMAGNPEYSKHITFIKVNSDKLKGLLMREEVLALPFVKVYRKGDGCLYSFQAVSSKLKQARTNLQTMIQNPGKYYKKDPNGFLQVADKPTSNEEKASKAAAVEQLSSQRGSLFDKLMKVDVSQASTNGAEPKEEEAPSKVVGKAAPNRLVTPAMKDHRMELAKAIFMNQNKDYGYNGQIDKLYATEIAPRLQGQHYLDYTGSSVYGISQIQAAFDELQQNMFGNPHSANPSSKLTLSKIDEVRDMILNFFGADPVEYQCVFTKSATAALKLVGETFPWAASSQFRYLLQNHNSVLGMREYALEHQAQFQAVTEDWVGKWVSGQQGDEDMVLGPADDPYYSLFAFPAEDNFAGVKYPLGWIDQIHAKSVPGHRWKVLVDAAAYVPTQPLNLTEVKPDFVAVSFYKMFGFPTGLGALLLKTEDIDILKKVYWGGGSVSLVTSKDNFHVLKCRPSDKLEDGTVAFLDVINLKHGFKMIESLGGVNRIQAHVRTLTGYFYKRLSSLRHSTGRKMVQVFGKHGERNWAEVQGGILNFEMFDPSGEPISYKLVEKEAAAAGYHIRAGAECNPGACYNYLGLEDEEIESLAGIKEGCSDDVEYIQVKRPSKQSSKISSSEVMSQLGNSRVEIGHQAELALKWTTIPLGTVRASLGYMSTFEDVEGFVNFLESKYKDRAVDINPDSINKIED